MPYIDPEVVAQARKVDLLSYLQERDPEELVSLGGGTWCTRTHDSLKISNGKWYWWSRGIGGRSALDYLIAVREMGFVEAVQEVVGGAACDRAQNPSVPPKRSAAPKPREFRLPAEAGTERALAYLRGRGIDAGILEALAAEGAVYGSQRFSHQNVVFVGRDAAGTPRYAAIRSCSGDFKGEAAGSDKRFSFSVEQAHGPIEVHVFESAVDALSFATLKQMEGRDWRSFALLSLGGISPVRADRDFKIPDPLTRWLDEHPLCSEVHLHLDSDEPGRAAARAIAERLAPRVPVSIEPPPCGKDINDYLTALRNGRSHRRAAEREQRREGR